MNCTCIKDLESKIAEHLAPKVKNIQRVTCENISFSLSEELKAFLSIPFRVKADHPGYRSEKGKALPVRASYCPFCGENSRAKDEAQPTTSEPA